MKQSINHFLDSDAQGSSQTESLAPAVAFHDDLAQDWNDKYSRAIFQQRAERFRSVLAAIDLQGKTWVDAGCGTGTLSRMLAGLGAQVLGFDASPQMIEAANQHSTDSSAMRFEAITTIERMPLKDHSVDGVICSSVIEYLDRPSEAIAEFYRVLRPGGTLIVTVPHRRSFLILIQRTLFWVTSHLTARPVPAYMTFSKNRYTQKGLLRLMKSHGFLMYSIQFTSYWPSFLTIRSFANLCMYCGTKSHESVAEQ